MEDLWGIISVMLEERGLCPIISAHSSGGLTRSWLCTNLWFFMDENFSRPHFQLWNFSMSSGPFISTQYQISDCSLLKNIWQCSIGSSPFQGCSLSILGPKERVISRVSDVSHSCLILMRICSYQVHRFYNHLFIVNSIVIYRHQEDHVMHKNKRDNYRLDTVVAAIELSDNCNTRLAARR